MTPEPTPPLGPALRASARAIGDVRAGLTPLQRSPDALRVVAADRVAGVVALRLACVAGRVAATGVAAADLLTTGAAATTRALVGAVARGVLFADARDADRCLDRPLVVRALTTPDVDLAAVGAAAVAVAVALVGA